MAAHSRFQTDYMFMQAASDDKAAPCLSFIEIGGCVLARRLDKKSAHENIAKEIVVQLQALGFTGLIVLQGGKEHSLRDLMRKIAGARGAATVLRYSAKGSKGSQG